MASDDSATPSPPAHALPYLTLVCLVTFAVYLPTLGADFVRWDDNINVYDNEHVQGLTWANLQWMFADISHALRYKPLSWLAWCLVHEICGLNPLGYHLLNIVVHGINAALACLLFAWLLRGGEREPSRVWICAALGALAWSLHPLRVEPVAWVTGLPYDLSLMFALAACALYWRSTENEGESGINTRLYWAAVTAYALALITYPIILGLCIVPALMDGWRRLRGESTASWLQPRHLPFLLGAAVLVGVNLLGRMSSNPLYVEAASLDDFSVFHRVMQGFYVWTVFLLKNLWPAGLAPAYSDLLEFDPWSAPFVGSALFVAGVSVLVFRARERLPLLCVLWGCHLIWLVPVLGLTEDRHTPSDRYTYVAGLLVGLLVAAALSVPLSRVRWQWARICAGVALGACALQSSLLIRAWHDSESLFLHTIARARTQSLKSDFWRRLGHHYLLREEFTAAEIAYVNALPQAVELPDLHYRIAFTQFRQNKFHEAIPHYEIAHHGDALKGEFLSDYGIALVATGNLEAAAAIFAEAVKQDPAHAGFRRNLALTLQRLGREEESLAQSRLADLLDAGQSQ